MKNHTDSVPLTFVEFADAVVQSHLIITACSLLVSPGFGPISAQEASRNACILSVSCRSMTNFAKMLAVAEFRRNSGMLWRRALATTVTDDSDINCEVARRILENEGARVHLAADGSQALETLRLAAEATAKDPTLTRPEVARLLGITTRRLNQVIAGEARGRAIAVLSGPSFAIEVARGMPTAVVVASTDPSAAARVAVGRRVGGMALTHLGCKQRRRRR